VKPVISELPSAALPEAEALLTQAGIDASAEAAKSWARLWVAKPLNEASAVAVLLTWWVADQVEIASLFTDPGARRQGHARALLLQLLSAARAAGVISLWLEVRAENIPAQQLYTALGFAVTRRRAGYYTDGEDALEMALELAR
jgi:[ribosomal protein S18]-alanine N-acetyltransferase